MKYRMNIVAENPQEEDNVGKVKEAMDFIMNAPTVLDGSVMPDACPTGGLGSMPVGGVVEAKNAIHPNWHSADICCSLYMTEYSFSSAGREKAILDRVHDVTHFGGGGRDDFDMSPELRERYENNPFLKDTASWAGKHIGTQGDGNHFAFVGVRKSTGHPCLVTHHGSRGPGARLYSLGKKIAEDYRKKYYPNLDKSLAWIPFDTEDGQNYWEALQIIRAWTKENHEIIHFETFPDNMIVDQMWNEHNFVFKQGESFFHAKGATPLMPHFVPDGHNELRIVPMNMAEPILLVKGDRNSNNIGFAPHGAGRNMSRTQHAKEALVGKSGDELFKEETEGLDVRFFHGKFDISEFPSAYKSADKVKKDMERFRLCEVVDEIMPYGCIMAGHWKKSDVLKKKGRNNA